MRKSALIVLVCLGIGVLFAVFRPWSSSSDTSDHVIAAIRYHNKAVEIDNKGGGAAMAVVKPEEWKAIVNYDEQALAEARQANISEMNKTFPSFGDHFRDEFIGGLQLFMDHRNDPAPEGQEFLVGQMLLDKFGDWYEANSDGIRRSNK